MNSITDLLDLEDSDIIISDIQVDGTEKIITLETPVEAHFCPCCSFRMHSKGIKVRTISHPILQDGYHLILHLRQRRWKCTNPACQYVTNESFRFVNPRRRSTNSTDILIFTAFRDITMSAAAIAEKFKTSDTHVLEVFDRYVQMDRLPLTDIISVDEVYLDLDDDCKYALVIQDFHTGDPIDLLRSRRTKVTEPYFASIPVEERLKVKYLISDMYNPYIAYVPKYFPNAVPVVDSFHVIQWIVHSIDMYIRDLLKKFRKRDREQADEKSRKNGHPVNPPLSDEVYLLQKYRWLILSNNANINYQLDARVDRHFHRLMNTYDYEDALFRIDPRLRVLRDLKEKYIRFNTRYAGMPMDARIQLDRLIAEYKLSGQEIFRNFANLLIKYEEEILNSFVMAEKIGKDGKYESRLSNGPIESMNRKAKDLKRLGRGYRNFDHYRNRFLYAVRSNPIINSSADAHPVQYYQDESD